MANSLSSGTRWFAGLLNMSVQLRQLEHSVFCLIWSARDELGDDALAPKLRFGLGATLERARQRARARRELNPARLPPSPHRACAAPGRGQKDAGS
jgi:hypothetical protein